MSRFRDGFEKGDGGGSESGDMLFRRSRFVSHSVLLPQSSIYTNPDLTLRAELAYLGAPWEEYAEISTKLALPVIRIPMVEGYAPFSPASLDAHLSSIILEQSLQGSSVLSQCRGGQGRAGTVACCWMIKMGLVGDGRPVDEKHHQLDDAMRVVERVIEVIRRRRG